MRIESFRGEYYFLSNFYVAPFRTPRGTLVQTVEHAFQACKTLYLWEREQVLNAATPAAAKQLGRKVTLRPDWNEIRLSVMERLVELKFAQNSELAERLRETGDAHLVEGNTWGDTFWGACRGKGANHLGSILMQVRAGLTFL